MSVFWVNYDLNRSGKNYDDLIQYLKSFAAWAKPLKSSFLVKSDLTASDIRDAIAKLIDTDDEVLIVRVDGKSWASWGLSKQLNAWLKKNI